MKRYRCKIIVTTTLERVIEASCREDVFDEVDDLRTDEWTECDATWDVIDIVAIKGGA